VPRSVGKPGEPRSHDFPKNNPTVPKSLAARAKWFDENAGKLDRGFNRPGSQNPRKR
jgi:hypothetical protein